MKPTDSPQELWKAFIENSLNIIKKIYNYKKYINGRGHSVNEWPHWIKWISLEK